jgi:hypothetical protein
MEFPSYFLRLFLLRMHNTEHPDLKAILPIRKHSKTECCAHLTACISQLVGCKLVLNKESNVVSHIYSV